MVRIALCTPAVPEITGLGNHQPAMEAIHAQCGSTPVVFQGSFQKPSLYRYYTGENGMALSSIYDRQTQFDILQLDKDLQGKEVYVVSQYESANTSKIANYEYYYQKFEHFQGANRIEVLVEEQRVEADTAVLEVIINNPYDTAFDFNHPELPVEIYAIYLMDDKYQKEKCETIDIQSIPSKEDIKVQLKFKYLEGETCVICLGNQISISVNSRTISM